MLKKLFYMFACVLVGLSLGGCNPTTDQGEPIAPVVGNNQTVATEMNNTTQQEFQYCNDITPCFTKGLTSYSSYGEFVSPVAVGFMMSLKIIKPTISDVPGNKLFNIIFSDDDYIEDDITYDEQYSLGGKIMKNVESVEVIRDGDNTSYFLKEFVPHAGAFSYNISTTLGNLRPGTNRYLVRGYQSPNIIYERVFELKYITGGQDIVLTQQMTEKKHEIRNTYIPYTTKRYGTTCTVDYGKYAYSIHYPPNREIYYLGFSPYTFAKQIFKHDTGVEIIYQTERGLTQSVITIRNPAGKLSNSIIYAAGCPTAEKAILADFLTGGYVTIDKGSKMTRPLIYNPNKNTIIDMMKDLVLPFYKGQPTRDYYVGDYTLSGNNLTLTVARYYYQQYSQELIFDIDTKKLIQQGEII